MNTYRFDIEGTIDSWLDADELKLRLVVALCGVDSNGDLTQTITDDEIEVADYEKCEVAQICPHDNAVLRYRMFDLDGTNLEERSVCPECGYNSPSLK